MARSSSGGSSPEASKVSKPGRRPHRKSRNGCINCKRRKVKCDEVKPVCANCERFGIPCDFTPCSITGKTTFNVPVQPLLAPRRGPGRPRRDWAALPIRPQTTGELAMQSPSTTASSPEQATSPFACSLNVSDAELLFQFISYTADTLAAHDNVGTKVHGFWQYNALRIGMSYHFVLHLCYSVAAYHLAYLEPKGDSRGQHITLAEQHASLGLGELNRELSNLNETNCGALYLSAVLVCYSAFAAGPTSSTDLLICDVGEAAGGRRLPLIHGARLIRQTIEPTTIFAGLMAPLGPLPKPKLEAQPPACVRDGFRRIEWIEPLEKARALIASEESLDTAVYMRSFNALWNVYEATYGGKDGTWGGSSRPQFVFVWLYRIEDSFVASLRRREPFALLLLAYYAPLLKTMRDCWFLDGWAEHLLKTIAAIIDPTLVGWVRWPMEVSGMRHYPHLRKCGGL